MKTALLVPLLLVAGTALGGGSGYAVRMVLGDQTAGSVHAAETKIADVQTTFVPLPRMLAPLVLPDGRLSGYAAFELQLEVKEEDADMVMKRLPYLQHAINLRTFQTPLGAGTDGAIPDIAVFRKVAEDAAKEAFGADVVRRVAVTGAVPA